MNNRRLTLIRPSQIFNSFMDEFWNMPKFSGDFDTAKIDLYEDSENVFVDIEAPGFTKENVEISVQGDLFFIKGEKSDKNSFDEKNVHINEISSSSFSRSLTLPCKVDAEKAKAKFEDGVIKIQLPKLAESKPKKIAITTN